MDFFKLAGKIYHFNKPDGKKFPARIVIDYGYYIEMQDMSWNGERFFVAREALYNQTGG